MTNEERLAYFESGRLGKRVKIALLDWLGGKVSTGTAGITDPLERLQMEQAIYLCLVALDDLTRKVSELAISGTAIKKAETEEAVTDSAIQTVVNTIMSTKLEWLTGIHSLPDFPAE